MLRCATVMFLGSACEPSQGNSEDHLSMSFHEQEINSVGPTEGVYLFRNCWGTPSAPGGARPEVRARRESNPNLLIGRSVTLGLACPGPAILASRVACLASLAAADAGWLMRN
jgi:hypothetical protein